MINLFEPNNTDTTKEQFDTLVKTKNIRIEKISSFGQTSTDWYEQARNEWVVVIEGEGKLLFEDGSEQALHKGEYIHIPKMQKHKVIYSANPTIWLAIHFD